MNGAMIEAPTLRTIPSDVIPIGGGGYSISRTQLKQIVDKIIREANNSVVRIDVQQDEPITPKGKRKTASFRICPMCDKAVGNFGNNFRNHLSSCSPVVYDELLRVQPLYFGTFKDMKDKGLITHGLFALPENLYNNGQGLRPLHKENSNSEDEEEEGNSNDEDSSSLPPSLTNVSSPPIGFLNTREENGYAEPPPSNQFGSDDQSLKNLMRILAEQQQVQRKEQKRKNQPTGINPIASPTGNRRLTFQPAPTPPPAPSTPIMSPTMISPMHNPFFSLRMGGTPTTPTTTSTPGGSVLHQLAAQHRVFNVSQPIMHNQQSGVISPTPQPVRTATQQHYWMLQNNANYYLNNIIFEAQNASEPNFERYEQQQKQIKQMQRKMKAEQLQHLQQQIQLQLLQGEIDEDNPQFQNLLALDDDENDQDQPQNETWLENLYETSLNRYLKNAQFMNETFFKDLKEEPEPSKEDLEIKKQQLHALIDKIDREIKEEERKHEEKVKTFIQRSNMFKRYYTELENTNNPQEREKLKRKLSQLSQDFEQQNEMGTKRARIRNSDDYLFPIQ